MFWTPNSKIGSFIREIPNFGVRILEFLSVKALIIFHCYYFPGPPTHLSRIGRNSRRRAPDPDPLITTEIRIRFNPEDLRIIRDRTYVRILVDLLILWPYLVTRRFLNWFCVTGSGLNLVTPKLLLPGLVWIRSPKKRNLVTYSFFFILWPDLV